MQLTVIFQHTRCITSTSGAFRKLLHTTSNRDFARVFVVHHSSFILSARNPETDVNDQLVMNDNSRAEKSRENDKPINNLHIT